MIVKLNLFVFRYLLPLGLQLLMLLMLLMLLYVSFAFCLLAFDVLE